MQDKLNSTSSTQLNIFSADIQRVALRVSTRRALTTVKDMAHNHLVLQRVFYYAPHLTSSLKKIRKKSEKPAQKLLGGIQSIIPYFPTRSLHRRRKVAGFGIKCPTTL